VIIGGKVVPEHVDSCIWLYVCVYIYIQTMICDGGGDGAVNKTAFGVRDPGSNPL